MLAAFGVCMTPAECAAETAALLPSLAAATAFSVRVAALPIGGTYAPPPPDAADAPLGARPPLHVLCRDASSADASFAPIDALGSSRALAGAGYFEARARGGELHVISDRVRDASALRILLTHELVHAADAAVHGLDLSLCGALACSEVRAAAAADCAADTTPWWWRAACARRVAVASAAMVFPAEGAACVRAVFAPCFALAPGDSPGPAVARALAAEAATLR